MTEYPPSPMPLPRFTKAWHNKPYPSISPYRPELSAAGKNIVVTGGGTGIGKAIAIAFASAGAKSVSILGRREDRLISSAEAIRDNAANEQCRVLYYNADLGNRSAVNSALDSIVDHVGKISVFVANAAVAPTPGLLESYEVDDFITALDRNVRTTLNSVQAFASRAAPDAVLINITSGLVHIEPLPGMAAYTTSKAASLKMVEHFAAENPSIHVVSIQPGIVKTEANADHDVEGQDAAELPGEFSVWLASPQARFLKSKLVWANWDVDELAARSEEIEKSALLVYNLEGPVML